MANDQHLRSLCADLAKIFNGPVPPEVASKLNGIEKTLEGSLTKLDEFQAFMSSVRDISALRVIFERCILIISELKVLDVCLNPLCRGTDASEPEGGGGEACSSVTEESRSCGGHFHANR
eukprot:186758-Amorphochlora_amoeboformis.AAC.1